MIELVFVSISDELMHVKIVGTKVLLGSYPHMLLPMELIGLNKATTIAEFPDLADDPKWRDKAIIRWNMHINQLGTEEKIEEYIINDLKKTGHELKMRKKYG